MIASSPVNNSASTWHGFIHTKEKRGLGRISFLDLKSRDSRDERDLLRNPIEPVALPTQDYHQRSNSEYLSSQGQARQWFSR